LSQEIANNWYETSTDQVFLCDRFARSENITRKLCFESILEPETGYKFSINAVLKMDDYDDYSSYEDSDYYGYPPRYQPKYTQPKYSEPWIKKKTTSKNIKAPIMQKPEVNGKSIK
jgi:hypothetical protein